MSAALEITEKQDVEFLPTKTETSSSRPVENEPCRIFELPITRQNNCKVVESESQISAFEGRRTLVKLMDTEFIEETPPKQSHAADPIKNVEDIWKVQEWLINHNRYRDNLLFTCGVNFGLRVGDLLKLKVGHILNADGRSYKAQIELTEEKTSKRRVVFLNDAVMDAADLYFNDLQARKQLINLNDYLFKSRSNNGKNTNKPIDIRNVDRMLKDVINKKCGLDIHASTHCLRKTFAYHVIMGAKDRSRAVEFLQKIFGHSSASITLMYAGITDDEVRDTYQQLNLGIKQGEYHGFNWARSSGYAFKGNKSQEDQ